MVLPRLRSGVDTSWRGRVHKVLDLTKCGRGAQARMRVHAKGEVLNGLGVGSGVMAWQARVRILLARMVRRLWQVYRVEAGAIVLAVVLLCLGVLLGVARPWPLAWLVDGALAGKGYPSWVESWLRGFSSGGRVTALVLLSLGLHLAHLGAGVALHWVLIQTGLRAHARTRVAVYAQLLRLSARFHQSRPMGDLIQRAAWDTFSVHTVFQQGVFQAVQSGLTLGLMLGVMFSVDAGLGLSVVGFALVLMGVTRFWVGRMSARGADAQSAEGQVTESVQQVLAVMPLIQASGRGDLELDRHRGVVGRAGRLRGLQHGVELMFSLVAGGVFALAVAWVTWLGAREVLAGALGLGSLLVFLAYLAQLHEPLNQILQVGTTMTDALGRVRRVWEVLDAVPEVVDGPDARPATAAGGVATGDGVLKVRGDLGFEGVGFEYVPGRRVLRGITFKVEPGEVVLLEGASGAGKSTLMQLVPRFFDPDAGAVTLDGVDVRRIKLADVRRLVMWVGQEPMLLAGTVAENIACGVAGVSRERIEAAARSARADGFIRGLPLGYDTVLGSGEARLSVGERQRLGLARAFLADAPVLLLDEPTSALDAENEGMVVEALRELVRGRAVLLASHRPGPSALATRRERVLVRDETDPLG